MQSRKRLNVRQGLGFALLLVGSLVTQLPAAAADPIRNPYYAERLWKLWSLDDSPVSASGATVQSLELHVRQSALKPDADDLFRFEKDVLAETPYSGFWDDVYCNQDKGHSHVIAVWKDDHGNEVTLRDGYISHRGVGTFFSRQGNRIDVGGDDLNKLGANFTSQSTTGMGHDITNDPTAALVVERSYYFADVLKSGPAHLSFYDIEPEFSDDKYEALNPTFYNSVGSSGSESWALGKMMIAGAYLKTEVKQSAKQHGLFPATLLYIWKAGLPYDVPYGNELRHRVAYFSKGDHSDYLGANQVEFNEWYHRYDETEHMRGMLAIAKSLDSVPPVAILKDVRVTGAREVYAHKASALFHQVLDAGVRVNFSARDCYDVDGKPVTTRVEVLSGHPAIEVKQTTEQDYQITIPGDATLPQGRTALALIANNGESDGNPAIITIFRPHANRNRRPELEVPSETNILPGELASFPVEVRDPEGFDVSIYRPSNEIGAVANGRFDWQSNDDQPPGQYPVTFIASDRTSGSSQNSRRSMIHVRTTVAQIDADVISGKAPLTVALSASNSRDVSGKPLEYRWNFDDNLASTEANLAHPFSDPGFYQVSLDVAGTSRHRDSKIIHVKHDWPLQVDVGSGSDANLARTWRTLGVRVAAKRVRSAAGKRQKQIEVVKSTNEVGNHGLFLNKVPRVPFYLEYESMRKRGSPGAGLEVSNIFLGCPRETTEPKPFGPDMSLVTRAGAERLITQPVWGRSSTTIRMYVTEDPANRGRLRIRGFVDWKQGSTFFRADGVDDEAGAPRILAGDKPGTTTINRFKIWHL